MPKTRKGRVADRGKQSPQEEGQMERGSDPGLQEEMTTEYLTLLESMKDSEKTGPADEEKEESTNGSSHDEAAATSAPSAGPSGEPPKKKSPFENAFLSFIDERDKSVHVFGERHKSGTGKSLKDIRIQDSGSDQSGADKTNQSQRSDNTGGQSGASTSKDQSGASSNGSQSKGRKKKSQPEDEDSADDSSGLDEKAGGESIFESVDLDADEEEEEKEDKKKKKKPAADFFPRRMSSRQAAQRARTAFKEQSEDSDSDGPDTIERQQKSSVLKASADSTADVSGATETDGGGGPAGRGARKQAAGKRRGKRRHSEVDDDDDNDPEWNPTLDKTPSTQLKGMPPRNSSNTVEVVTSSDEEISDDGDMPRGRTQTQTSNQKKRPLQPPKVVVYPPKVVKTAASSTASGSRAATTSSSNTSGGRQEPTGSNVVSSSVSSSNEMINIDPIIISDAESESEEESRMNYVREEFVVNTDHLSDENHPIWQIQKTLLKKYVPYQDRKHWYIASNSYLGWFGSEKAKFRPVRCRFVRKERNADIVKVVKPRRAGARRDETAPDTTNEAQTPQQSLADSFKIYLQAVVSQVLDHDFLPCVEEEKDDYFQIALRSLDERLEEAKRTVCENLGWVSRFRIQAESMPTLREEEGEPGTGVLCQACEKQGHVAAKLLRLEGRPYNRLTLQDKNTSSTSNDQSQLLQLGRVCGERVMMYHRLHHYRYQLYRRCMAKVMTLQETHPEYPQEEVVRQILKNITWVKQVYEELRTLLENCQATKS